MDIFTFAFANIGSYDIDRPIFIDAKNPSQRISISQARQLVRQLMAGLQAYGVLEGDCVCLHAHNNVWYPLMCLGIVGVGAIVSGINPASTTEETVRHFNLIRPEFIIVQSEHSAAVLAAARRCNIPESRIFYHGPKDSAPFVHAQHWRVLLSHGEIDPPRKIGDGDAVLDKPAFYAMTSGTTGRPKAAVISHRSVVARTASLQHLFENRSCQLIFLPLFHAFASTLGLLLPLRVGVPTYFLPRFVLEDFLHAVEAFAISDVPVVPTIVNTLTQLPPSSRPALNNLRRVISAGAPLSSDRQLQLARTLHPQAVVSQCWGTTEIGWHTISDCHDQDMSGSVGRVLPDIHLKLMHDQNGLVQSDDIPGEAFVRSPGAFSGYLRDPEATSAAFDADGFYATGDQVRTHKGLIFYQGRTKEIMKVNGWQVSPAELEDVLLQHPMVLDAAVVGIERPDHRGGWNTLPRAYIVPAISQDSVTQLQALGITGGDAKVTLLERAIQDFVASRLISYKRLTGGVSFVSAIPRSDTGKILRRELASSQVQMEEEGQSVDG